MVKRCTLLSKTGLTGRSKYRQQDQVRWGETSTKKNDDNNNIPADKNILCSEKRIQVCNFSSVFQTLLNSNFIDAVYTSEIHFSQKFSPKSRCGLYANAGYTPLSTVISVSLIKIGYGI